MKQVRKITKSYRSIVGHVSYRGYPLPFESTLERDFLMYHTFANNVLDITPQPISIPFKKNGRTYRYTPDYFIQFKAPQLPVIAEVKPYQEWQKNWRNWSEKWKAAMAYCREQGFVFHIYDENRIRHRAWENIRFLQTYKNLNVDMTTILTILKQIELMGMTTVEYILNLWFNGKYRQQGHLIMWHLMANKLVGFDIWHHNLPSEQVEIWHLPIETSLDNTVGGMGMREYFYDEIPFEK